MTTNLLDRVGSAAFLAAAARRDPRRERLQTCTRPRARGPLRDTDRPHWSRRDRSRSHRRALARPVLTTREIEALIPHRWPFLLVDRIVEYDPEAKRIVGLKGVTATEWFFQGHFPGLPVMPGVLQVEALAQTMAVYVAKQPGFGDRIGLFAGIDDTRFKRIVSPATRFGSRSRWRSSVLGSGAGRASPSVDGEVACEATISFVIPAEGVLR